MSKTSAARHVVKLIFASILVLFFFVMQQTGWFSGQRSWKETSGWQNIPLIARPAFTDEEDGDPQIYWLGHSGFFIKWAGTTLLLDPNLSQRCTFVWRAFPAPLRPEELPDIDAALISHAHFDHLDNPTLDGIKTLQTLITPQGTEEHVSTQLRERTNSIGLKLGESTTVGELRITAVRAIHRGGRFHPLKSKYFAVGYIISDGKTKLYYSGDTAFGKHFKDIAKRYQPTLAILPIGGYEPNFVLRYHHLNPTEAVRAAEGLGVKKVIPCHFGTFRLAFDFLNTGLQRFAKECTHRNVAWKMPRLVNKGVFSDES